MKLLVYDYFVTNFTDYSAIDIIEIDPRRRYTVDQRSVEARHVSEASWERLLRIMRSCKILDAGFDKQATGRVFVTYQYKEKK